MGFNHGWMKLLIADDDARIRNLLRQLCAGVATETRDCTNGEEAIETFGSFKPDWTVMDLAMPQVDGLAATKRIVTAHPGARVIMITQYRGPEYEEAAREAGACAFLRKDNLQSLAKLLAPTGNCSGTTNPTRISQ